MVVKRKTRMQCTILAVLLFTVVFYGCPHVDTSPYGSFEHLGLSAATEKRILQDYFNTYIKPTSNPDKVTIKDLYIIRYYGTYNGCVVVVILVGPWDYWGVVSNYIISDVQFYHGHPPPQVWKGNRFYGDSPSYQPINSGGGLREAYDLGILTHDDLMSIAERMSQFN